MSTTGLERSAERTLDIAWVRSQFPSLETQVNGQSAAFLDGPAGTQVPTQVMQAIAKEMSFSETTFVLPAETADTDVRVRIFTPGDELPMAGPPSPLRFREPLGGICRPAARLW